MKRESNKVNTRDIQSSGDDLTEYEGTKKIDWDV